MILQRSDSGLYVPYEPPKQKTQAELMAEYRSRHRYCPSCGSDGIEQTCIGRMVHNAEEYVDPNTGTCTTCGWHGRVHDLTAERNSNMTLDEFVATVKEIGNNPPLSACATGCMLTDLVERFEASQRKESK